MIINKDMCLIHKFVVINFLLFMIKTISKRTHYATL